MTDSVLITVPDLTIIGGKANYYSALQGRFAGKVQYFTYGSRGKGNKEGKMAFVKRMLMDYWNFYKTIRKDNFGIVHINPSLEFNGFFRDALFLLIAKAILGKKVVVFWRGWSKEFELQVEEKYMWFMRKTYLKASSSIVLAKEFEQKLRQWGYAKPIYQETTVLDEFLIDGLTNEKITEKYAATGTQLLFLARLERNKGIFEILEVYQKLKTEYPELSLVVAGDGGAMAETKSVIAENKIADVTLLGFVRSEQKRQALLSSHVYLFPSWHGEGLPNSLLEAMGCGMPVLTTANAGIKDFFEHEKMGLILDDCSSEELLSKLQSLLADRNRQLKIALYGHEYAKEHFAASKVVKRLEAIYSDVSKLQES